MAEMEPSAIYGLEQNLSLMAGAGAGKTHSLVTLCLHLLGGARADGRALQPGRLWMLTFTDKAASEMRARLSQRLDALAGGSDEPEAMLRSGFARHGHSFPPKEFWCGVRDGLGMAAIGTFHSLCAQLLRGAPAGSGVDPDFELLEERDALELLENIAERMVLQRLEREDRQVIGLCRELGFKGRDHAEGLVDHLCAVLGQAREAVPLEGIPISRLETCHQDLELEISRGEQLVGEAIALDSSRGGRFEEVLSACRRALRGMTVQNFCEAKRFPALRQAIAAEPNLAKQHNHFGGVLKQIRSLGIANGGRLTLEDYYGGCAVVPYETTFRDLLVDLEERYRGELAKRGVLDFSELLIRTRDLLRDQPLARRQVQEQVQALLVDEFQDTNRIQLEIVTLLAEERSGGSRAIGAQELAGGQVPLEPGFLCIVGDAKQSIYEFRGADVAVIGRMAAKIEQEGGWHCFLRQNWRSEPGLLDCFNRIFSELMQSTPPSRDYEIAYQRQRDDQQPVRSAPSAGPAIDWLVFEPEETAEDCRSQDAALVARRIQQLLAPDSRLAIELENGERRSLRGGDIAILLRRFSFLEGYRQALIRLGIPHRVYRGRGFYGAQEVLDLASLLSLLADPADALAFAAVLRSPWVALSDASLFRLSIACGGRLCLRGVQAATQLELPVEEQRRLARFLRLYPTLRRERDRLGIRVLLRGALDETGYRVGVAGSPFGEQALANIDKLLEMAGHWDASEKGDCATFARRILALADSDPSEGQADVIEVGDARAVQILTIHQAKGLEWPVVAIPDLGAQRNRGQGRVLFDRDLGLAIKPWIGPDSATGSPRAQRIAAELARRDDAEYVRLLYVAMTRARDRLILSGQTRRQAGTWRATLERILAGNPALRSAVQTLGPKDLEVSRAPVPDPPAPKLAPSIEADRALNRVRAPRRPAPARVILPVTHLQDFFLCSRRFHYAHQAGLSEFPWGLGFAASRERGGRDPKAQGILAHHLLESAKLSLLRGDKTELRAHLESLIWSQGFDPKAREASEVLQWVEGFMRTAFAARLAAADPERVHRELPFLLQLCRGQGPEVFLKGKIDLLFEDEAGFATLLDYKTSARDPGGLTAYSFQLASYALAARRLVKESVPLRTGIVFLRDPLPEPEIQEATEMDWNAFEARLFQGAIQLLERTARAEWPGLAQVQCEAIHCGYQYRCHSQAAAV
jgi:ATP-dependent exoDNAse (exonuclease V) beta subunit